MRMAKTCLALVLAIGSCVVYSMVRPKTPVANSKKSTLRVGTFDSRAIAIAYAHTEEFNQSVKKLMEEHKKAKAESNERESKNWRQWVRQAKQNYICRVSALLR